MLRLIALALVLALLVPAPGWADFEQDKRRCNIDPNPDIKIDGCTRLIQSGRFGTTNLAFTFNDRGIAYENKGQYNRAIRDYYPNVRSGFRIQIEGIDTVIPG